MKKIILVAVVICTALILVLESCNDTENRIDEIESLGCENFEDCITKYKFEEARKYESELNQFHSKKRGALRKIITSEITYYISNSLSKMAFNSIYEYTFRSSAELQSRRDGNDSYNEEANWYNSQIEKIVIEFEDDPKTIKKLIYSMKPILIFKNVLVKYIDSDTGLECCSHLDECIFEENYSKQELLIKRYKL